MTQREELNKRWENQWAVGATGWHYGKVNPLLEEFFHLFNDVRGKRILVPLCGKAVDLKWLYDQGMSVVGVEVAELAAIAFFSENGYDFKVVTSDGHKIYRHDDRLCIYLCDVFELDSSLIGGECDFLWDRGALVAMVYDEQAKYWKMIDSLLSSTAEGLFEIFEYERSVYPGPPHSITRAEFSEIVGDKYDVEQLCYRTNEELTEGYTALTAFENYRTMYYIKAK